MISQHGVFGCLFGLFKPEVPDAADDIRGAHVVCIVSDQAQHKGPVLPEIAVHELVNPAVVLLEPPRAPQVVLDEPHPVLPPEEPHQPLQQPQDAGDDDEHQPEPEERVDLLVPDVQGQRALQRIALDVGQPPHVEVAEGDSRERRVGRVLPLVVWSHPLKDL